MLKKSILLLLLIFGLSTNAQEVSLYQQFLGKYDFTMIGNTMNTEPNGANGYCFILTSSEAELTLEPGQEIEAAYLYWAGSGTEEIFDFDIELNGVPITPDRIFATDIAGRGVSGGFKDVTAQVIATGNGIYTVSELDLNDAIQDYCANGTNFGGWSILVVYKDLSLGSNLVNIYDGFSRVDSANSFMQFQLSNLNVLNLVGNRIAFLAWEGDENIAVQEQLKINGNLVSNPPLNPSNNVFNGTNSFTNSNQLYNMDLDFFDISAFTNIGDSNMTVSIESHQDAVILNNIVLVLNTEVPDATIEADAEYEGCDNYLVTVNYTVKNTIATNILPAATPIAFYAGDTLIGTAATVNDIPVGGSESGQIELLIPEDTANPFILTVAVDDDGEGNSTVAEFNEDNNTDEIEIKLGITPVVNDFETLAKCDTNNDGFEIFDLTITAAQMLGDQTGVLVRYYVNENDAQQGNNNNINNPSAYTNTSTPQTLYIRMEDGYGCAVVTPFQIEIIPPAPFNYEIPEIIVCSPNSETTGITINLNQNLEAVLNGENPDDFIISFHNSQTTAMNGSNPIVNPESFVNTSSPQTIWVRKTDTDGCVVYGSFEIIINPAAEANYQVPSLENCSPDQSSTGILTDLTANQENILNGNDPGDYTITYHLTKNAAINGDNPIGNPENFNNTSSPQTIWFRMINDENCVLYGSFELIYYLAPLAHTAIYQKCSISGPAAFELNELNSMLVDNPNNLTFDYYNSQEDAENQTNPLNDLYTPPVLVHTVYIRITDTKGCFTIISAILETVINTAELQNTYYECDDPWEESDGFTVFDLTSLNNQIKNSLGLSNANISFYHTSEEAAEGINPIQNPANYTNTTNPEIIYARAEGMDGNCGGIAHFTIQTRPVPVFELPELITFCDYDAVKSFTFHSPFYSYEWTDADGNIISNEARAIFGESGEYTLEVRESQNGCPAKRKVQVLIDTPPVIIDIRVEDQTVTVSAMGGSVPYQYSINNGLSWTDNYIFEKMPGGLYDLLVRSKYGCVSSSKFFGVLGVPNFISPNGDGKNDYWEIRGLEAYPKANVKIFDRYGKIFLDRQLGSGFRWDGTYSGRPVTSGEYWYIITFEDGRKLSGHISVRNY